MYYILVIFSMELGDLYIFTDPSFDTYQECVYDITNPEKIEKYAKHLAFILPGKDGIENVYCIDDYWMEKLINDGKLTIEV